jgi:hypothetical protein
MRGMYHVQFLVNGKTVIEDNSYLAGTITSHAHSFYTSITKSYIANAVSSILKTKLESLGYTVTYDEANPEVFTVTANEAKAGEELTVQMYEYNADGRTVDPLLKEAIANANETIKTAGNLYSEEAVNTINEKAKAVEALIGTNPSLKEQADAKSALTKAISDAKTEAEQYTPSFSRTSVTKTGTGTVTFAWKAAESDTDKSRLATWVNNIAYLYIDGEYVRANGNYTVDVENGLVINSELFNKGDRESYEILLEVNGCNDFKATVTVNNYGAQKFYVRELDSNGKVLKTKTYTKDEIIALAGGDNASDTYYNTICGMAGVRTFRAQGVYLTDLFKDAGITFESGMTLKIRTNDCAEKNDPEDEDAYYRMGTFTYESLMQDRYYFPELYTSTELKEQLLAAGTFDDTVKTVLGASTKTLVQPMIAYNYIEKIYRNDQTDPATEEYSSLVSNERSFRFLFGLAMDAEDSSKVASDTTTFSATYCAFGIDVIHPAEPETTAPETTAPTESETTAPAESETTAPTVPETTAPTEPETTAPAVSKKTLTGEVSLSKTTYAYDGKEKKPSVTVGNLKAGTDFTVSYKNNVNPGKATVTITGKNNYKGTLTATFVINPAKVTGLKVSSNTTKSVKLTWTAQKNITGYKVYQYNSSKKTWSVVKTVKTNSVTVGNLKAGTDYQFKVCSYKSSYVGSYSATVKTATKPATVKITSLTASKKTLTAKWNKVSATGYEVCYSTSSKFTKSTTKTVTIKSAATVSKKITSLKAGKTYYVKVRAYKTVGSKTYYGEYSTVKNKKSK